MMDRQGSTSPWSQTMSRIHSPIPDNESVISNNQLETPLNNTTTKIMPLQDEPNSLPPRKRNNSLIPIELMINNSGEGGRECAALATVFGVPEYIDSKIFWQRQQYQHEGLLPKKQINQLLRPTTPSSSNGLQETTNNKYGYISVKNVSVVSRPIASSVAGANDDEAMLQNHEIQSKFFISSYVDSVLDPVGSNDLLKPSFPSGTSSSAPIPTPTKSFSLPKIPAVSKFNDILLEDENGCELMFPANPSSVLMHSSTPMIRTESLSSVNSSFTLPSQSYHNNKQQKQQQEIIMTQDEDEEAFKTTSKVVVIIGPPEIFDLLLSDDDERFIIWGPDPIVLSSSMATTTSISPERPSSYANLYNSQHNRPELKGFSSNTTSTLSRSKSIQNMRSGPSGQRPSFASVRLSAQLWSESLKLSRPATIKHSMSANSASDRPQNSSLLLKKAFGLRRYNSEKKPISGVSELEKKDIPKVIEAATIHKLVEKLTSTLDYTFMTDFFLTYRDFLNSEDLCQLLVSRFYWALQNDEESRRIVRIRTFVVFRHWLNNYFVHDFIGNRALRTILTEFLNKLPRHPLVKESPRDQRIVKILKRVVRRLKKLYYNRSSAASRVKVIPPPPPTDEQKQMGEIVRAKLSQNAIRRKAALGVDMSSHHNGNMAIQDARYATVVVVGSLNMKGSFIDSGVDSSSHHHFVSKSSSFPLPLPVHHGGQEGGSIVASGMDDSQTIRSSIHHRYDKSVHESTDMKGAIPTSDAIEASSVASVASDDSLESEISAGETVSNGSDDSDDDDQSHLQHDYFTEYDEHDRHWMQEQQETLEYFKSANSVNKQPTFDQSGLSQNSSGSSNQLNLTGMPMTMNTLSSSPTAISPIRPKIPPEFIQVENKADLTSDYSSPSTPTTPTHNASVTKPTKDINAGVSASKAIRRVPSERWCKTDDGYNGNNKHPLELDNNSKVLPDELLKELSGDESQHPQGRSPSGLSRKLSKKSIERRKSEKSLHDSASAWSSAPSSAATSPYLTGANSDHDIPEVPELPPLTPDMLDNHPLSKKGSAKSLKKKRNALRKKASNVEQSDIPVEPVDTFASIPYESTQITNVDEKQPENIELAVPKRRLSRALSKVFRHSHNEEEKSTKGNNNVKAEEKKTSQVQRNYDHQQEDVKFQHPENHQSSQLVSLIAQRLRHSSVDESVYMDDSKCDCVKCSGNKDASTTCRRLSVMLIADEERRRSFELRRKRGASIDMDQRAALNHVAFLSSKSKNAKDIKSGPVYLGHLQARSIIETNIYDDEDAPNKTEKSEHSDDEDDDGSTASYVPSERSIQTEAQASSSRVRMSLLSELTNSPHVPRSKLIELGIPPLSPDTQKSYESMSLQQAITRNTNTENTPSIPQHIPDGSIINPNSRCFIMSYRTSKLASQLCFIERDVLIKVGWEELIHCKWTKMDASGNINPSTPNDHYDVDEDDEKINYTRQSEQRRIEEQGIEQVIQRFNIVCQWVASEIVRTRNINERVKLIEKFIRLAKKCKMYSNYATLVQILLGLQSPAVARLEKTWSKVSTKCQKQLNKLTEFTSPMKNWKNIRDSMTEVAEEYGNSPSEVQVEMPGTTANRQKFKKTTRIKIPFGGCIPFLGIYLSDLVFNSEKPRYLKPNLESQKIYCINNTRNLPACLDQPLVNFRKHRVIATVIKRVLTFQGLATRYSFDEDQFLLEKCRNLQVLDATKIRELSVSLE